jgi:spore coat-associated protein N
MARFRIRVRVTSLLVLLAVVVMGSSNVYSGGTLAVFGDTATSTGNTFTAGSVDYTLTDANESAQNTVSASVGGTAMAPGDLVLGYVEVANSGTLASRYALTTSDTTAASAANTALSNALTVGVDSRAAGSACTAAQGGAGQTQVVAAGAALNALAVGSTAAGAQAGDRTLAGSGAERLCFYVTLPSGASATAAGGTASYTFTFTAEQTANNP